MPTRSLSVSSRRRAVTQAQRRPPVLDTASHTACGKERKAIPSGANARHIACTGHRDLRFTAVKRINCVCGLVVEGDDDDELWEKAQVHLAADHPDLVGKVSREDILAQAEEI